MRKSFVWIASLFLLFVAQGALADTFTWNGTNSDWFDSTNWTPTGVPAGGDTVILESGTTPQVDISNPLYGAPISITATNTGIIFN